MAKRTENMSCRMTLGEYNIVKAYSIKHKKTLTDLFLDGLYATGVMEGYEGIDESAGEIVPVEKPKKKKNTAPKKAPKKETKKEPKKVEPKKDDKKEVETVEQEIKKIKGQEGKKKKIQQVELETGKVIATFDSLKAVGEAGFNKGNVSQVCSGKKPKAHGFLWKKA